MADHSHAKPAHSGASHYGRLGAMVVLSFAAMYGLMYAMVDRTENVYANFNQLYMASLMTAAMVVLELALMRAMYHNRRINAAIMGTSVVAFIVFWMLTRNQTLISDKQFLRSMIPHHGGAILMCRRAPLQDAEVKRLCQSIISGQQAEIDQMRARLRDLDS
jgi:uncharacterized protein (DUF305 family)